MCRNAKVLLIISSLFSLSMGLSNIFINVFFFKETKHLFVIAAYNLIINIVTPIAFILSGILSKKKNGIFTLRCGLFIYALFFALILLIGDRGADYIYLLAVIVGLAAGFYWLTFNTLCCEFTDKGNRNKFNGLNGGLSGVAAIVGPMLSAYIISNFKGFTGYRVVFAITCSVFLILILISTIFKWEYSGEKLDYKKAFFSVNDKWKPIRKATFFIGFKDSSMMFLINIFAIEVFKKEIYLGLFALVAAAVTSMSYLLAQRLIKPNCKKKAILFGVVGSFISILPLLIGINCYSLIIYAIIDGFCLPYFMLILTSSTFNVIDSDRHREVEYMINRDLVLNGGRAISTIILIASMWIFRSDNVFKLYFLFLGVMTVFAGLEVKKLS